MYRTPAFACFEPFCFSPASTAVSLYELHGGFQKDRKAHFLFLFVSHMGYFCVFLSIPHTDTEAYINSYTHGWICTVTHFLIFWKTGFGAPCFVFGGSIISFMLHCPLLSRASQCSATETPAKTVSSNLNVPVLRSHFQLCFSGFCIRGETVEQLP